MSKAFALMLLATSILAAPAWAAQEPKAVKQDPRIQVVPYDENNPVKLHLVAGHTAVIEVTDKERVTDVFLSDGAHLKKSISGHFVFLKPIMEMPAQPIFIKTVRLDGTGDRLYPFMLDAYDPDPPAGAAACQRSGCDGQHRGGPSRQCNGRGPALHGPVRLPCR